MYSSTISSHNKVSTMADTDENTVVTTEVIEPSPSPSIQEEVAPSNSNSMKDEVEDAADIQPPPKRARKSRWDTGTTSPAVTSPADPVEEDTVLMQQAAALQGREKEKERVFYSALHNTALPYSFIFILSHIHNCYTLLLVNQFSSRKWQHLTHTL
jgi:hypothetical protein